MSKFKFEDLSSIIPVFFPLFLWEKMCLTVVFSMAEGCFTLRCCAPKTVCLEHTHDNPSS